MMEEICTRKGGARSRRELSSLLLFSREKEITLMRLSCLEIQISPALPPPTSAPPIFFPLLIFFPPLFSVPLCLFLLVCSYATLSFHSGPPPPRLLSLFPLSKSLLSFSLSIPLSLFPSSLYLCLRSISV